MQVRILCPDHRNDKPLDSGLYAQAIALPVRIRRYREAFAGSTQSVPYIFYEISVVKPAWSGFTFCFWRILLIHNDAVFIQGSFEQRPKFPNEAEILVVPV
jgi:hypothetical protein